ncbi:hypothetical protein ACFX1R_021483 [Malus domestica]
MFRLKYSPKIIWAWLGDLSKRRGPKGPRGGCKKAAQRAWAWVARGQAQHTLAYRLAHMEAQQRLRPWLLAREAKPSLNGLAICARDRAAAKPSNHRVAACRLCADGKGEGLQARATWNLSQGLVLPEKAANPTGAA